MRVTIIDNGSKDIAFLKQLVSGHNVSTIPYGEITTSNTDFSDVFVLSGGHTFPIEGNVNKLQREIDLVQSSNKPIFGICLGFELIGHVFGATLREMPHKEHGIIDITIVQNDPIFRSIPNFQVYESHRWVVSELGTELIPLATSRDGIEAVRHVSRPIYGVQFHPEMFVEKTCGDEIFNNFLEQVVSG